MFEDKTDTFEVKLQKLIEAFTELKAENSSLKQTISEKEMTINEMSEKISHLEARVSKFEESKNAAGSMIDDILNKLNEL
ncbi:MAG: cell division protein ZapB [Candidatus Cloacimonetes bacterium]|nr:cell division protein ZapB [Candidatus Cloacimonadota bacterium]